MQRDRGVRHHGQQVILRSRCTQRSYTAIEVPTGPRVPRDRSGGGNPA